MNKYADYKEVNNEVDQVGQVDQAPSPSEISKECDSSFEMVKELKKILMPPKVVKAPLWWRIKSTLRMLITGELTLPIWIWFVKQFSPRGVTIATAELYGQVIKKDGTVVNYGLLGRHVITTAGKKFVASAFANTVEVEILKYHGYGTGSTAAAAGDTALQTEFTTEYATDNTRPTGSQSADGTVTTYTTVATFSPNGGSTLAVTEWGLFSATSSGTLLDHQVFSAVNLVVANGDSLATTYVLTIA